MAGIKRKIAIGPLFGTQGGVNGHILSVERYTRHRATTFPSRLYNRFQLPRIGVEKFMENFDPDMLRRYDVLHSHVNPWFVEQCRAHRENNPGTSWIHTYHSLYFPEDHIGGLSEMQKMINDSLLRVAPQADIAICVSQWLQDYLSGEHGIRTVFLPNGYDSEAVRRAGEGIFFNAYHLEDFILFSGNFTEIKNPSLIVWLALQLPSTTFVMTGYGLMPGSFIETFKARPPDNLHIIGELKPSMMFSAMKNARSLVVTSIREGCPAAMLEALACGMKVIAPDHSGCREIVRYVGNGLLYSGKDELLEMVREGAGVPPDKAALARLQERYAWKNVIRKLDDLYAGPGK